MTTLVCRVDIESVPHALRGEATETGAVLQVSELVELMLRLLLAAQRLVGSVRAALSACLRTAWTWVGMQPSHWRVTPTASAIVSPVFASSRAVLVPASLNSRYPARSAG